MAPDIIEANAELDSPGQRELLSRRIKIKIAVARTRKIKKTAVRKKKEENNRRDHRKWRNIATIWRKVGQRSSRLTSSCFKTTVTVRLHFDG